MWQAAQWICALVALSCGASPGAAVVQSAYDRELTNGSKLHDDSLQVVQAKCRDDGANKYLCEITFISKKDSAERPFFDIVAITRVADGWELKSGLCKHAEAALPPTPNGCKEGAPCSTKSRYN
jgi:hypothetical protein